MKIKTQIILQLQQERDYWESTAKSSALNGQYLDAYSCSEKANGISLAIQVVLKFKEA